MNLYDLNLWPSTLRLYVFHRDAQCYVVCSWVIIFDHLDSEYCDSFSCVPLCGVVFMQTLTISDVNKDWTCKDKDFNLTQKEQG